MYHMCLMYGCTYIISIVLFNLKHGILVREHCNIFVESLLDWRALWLHFKKPIIPLTFKRSKPPTFSLIKYFVTEIPNILFVTCSYSLWTLNTNPSPESFNFFTMTSGSKAFLYKDSIPKIDTTFVQTKNEATIHFKHFFNIKYLKGIILSQWHHALVWYKRLLQQIPYYPPIIG